MSIAMPSLSRLPASERGITLADFLVPIRIGDRMGTRLRHLALVVVGALFIALTANYTVPVPGSPVPITGQTFSVLLVGGGGHLNLDDKGCPRALRGNSTANASAPPATRWRSSWPNSARRSFAPISISRSSRAKTMRHTSRTGCKC